MHASALVTVSKDARCGRYQLPFRFVLALGFDGLVKRFVLLFRRVFDQRLRNGLVQRTNLRTTLEDHYCGVARFIAVAATWAARGGSKGV